MPLPDGVPFTSACIVGCGVMTGFGSAVNAAKVEPGSSVVVLGCGGVGLNVIQGARGQRRRRASSPSTRRPTGARWRTRFGATDVLEPDAGDDDLAGVAADGAGR